MWVPTITFRSFEVIQFWVNAPVGEKKWARVQTLSRNSNRRFEAEKPQVEALVAQNQEGWVQTFSRDISLFRIKDV